MRTAHAAGVSTRDAGLTMAAAMSTCPHSDLVPVTLLLTGEHVATLCGDCLDVLPLAWGCSDCAWVEAPRKLCEPTPELVLAQPCRAHATPGA